MQGATPQTRLSQPIVVTSLLGVNPTASAVPRLKRNLSLVRPRGLLRQAPRASSGTADKPGRDVDREPEYRGIE